MVDGAGPFPAAKSCPVLCGAVPCPPKGGWVLMELGADAPASCSPQPQPESTARAGLMTQSH